MNNILLCDLNLTWFIGAVIVALFGVANVAQAAPLLPTFNSANFSSPTDIDNPWLSLPIGLELEYEGESDEGLEIVEISINGDTKKVNGINTLVYRDQVFVAGELVEDTRDYLAQDNAGNVWYLGEDVDNYEDGELADHDGSWLAGVDGAKPGYWMPANPKVGDVYRQEYYPGEAEDIGEVISLTATVVNELATYKNCLQTKDTNPLEPDVLEYKYYCKQVGALVLEVKPEDGERVELVEIELDGADEDEDEDDEEGEEGDDDEDEDDEDEDVRSNPNDNADIRSELRNRILSLLRQLIARLQSR